MMILNSTLSLVERCTSGFDWTMGQVKSSSLLQGELSSSDDIQIKLADQSVDPGSILIPLSS